MLLLLLLLELVQLELFDVSIRPGIFPLIHPLLFPVGVVVVALDVLTPLLLLFTPRPGGGPRDDLMGIGEPHNSEFCCIAPSDQLLDFGVFNLPIVL